MEFLHPTDFPLTVVTDASHGAGVGAGVAMEIGIFSTTAFDAVGVAGTIS